MAEQKHPQPTITVSDERAVEAGQLSQPAQANIPQANSVGFFEPGQMAELSRKGRLYLIADGLGGAASGQIASQYAIQKIVHGYYTSSAANPETALQNVIQQANVDIYARNAEHPERRSMATALVAALIHNNKLFVARVGDGRVYVVWDQDIEQLTPESASKPDDDNKDEANSDKKAATPLLPAKVETPPAPESKPAKPVTLQTGPQQGLGLNPQVKIETFSRRLFVGDVVVLCTGGLIGYVTEEEIARAVTRHTPEQAIARLVALANQRGNRDHLAISATRIMSHPISPRSMVARPLPLSPKWSDWETSPKPGVTAPMRPVTGAMPTQTSMGHPPTPTRQDQADETWEGRRWQPYLAVAVIALIIFCVLPWLVWRFLIPDDLIAAVPFLSGLAATEQPAEVALPDLEAAETAEAGEASTIAESPLATPTLSAAEGQTGAQVAESNSPLPTPTTAPASAAATPGNTAQGELAPESTPSVQLASPTPSPTLLPTIELPANCENKGRFVDDITVEDGSQFAPGEEFEKVWRIQNAGDCPWGPGYTVRFLSGDFIANTRELPVQEVTQPNSNSDIAVQMIAPATPGTYRSAWQMFDLKGEAFGPEMYIEIVVTPPEPGDINEADTSTVYDFIANADQATWTSGDVTYTLRETNIVETLELPAPQGLVVLGDAQLRGSTESNSRVLLTYPHQELGVIEGTYQVDTPLQPTDSLAATVGFIKLSILSDDGVTFEVAFTPDDGSQEQVILSRTVLYQDSPVTELQPLTGIEPGQTGTFTLRVLGGDSLNQDWAVWIDLRIIRP